MDTDSTAGSEPQGDPGPPPYRLPPPLRRNVRSMPVAETAPRVPAALRAFNRGTPSVLRTPAAPPSPSAPVATPPPAAQPAPPPPAAREAVSAPAPARQALTAPPATQPMPPVTREAAPPASPPLPVARPEPSMIPKGVAVPVVTPAPLASPVQRPARPATPRPLASSPSELRAASVGALQLDIDAARAERVPVSGVLSRHWANAVALLAVAALVIGAIAFIRARSSAGVQTTPAGSEIAALIDQARQQAAAGAAVDAATKLEKRADRASGADRLQLREAAASLLLNASGAALQAGDPLTSLDDLEKAVVLADTQGAVQARLALPTARVTAARYLINKDTATGQAADLLRQTIADAPLSSAATAARDLLAAPVKVRGRLTLAGQPGAGLRVVLLPVSPSSISAASPEPATLIPAATGRSDAAGAFDLGAVAPSSYIFGFLDNAGQLHRAPGRTALVTLAPAQLNGLTEAIPS